MRKLPLVLLFAAFLVLSAQAAPPPARIFHFGIRANLKNDIAAQTVPLDFWNRSIMGADTNYGLVPYRRGLYGSSTPAAPVAYGDSYLGTGKMPWFMIIEIDRNCSRKPAILDHAPEQSYLDPRFLAWVDRVKPEPFVTQSAILDACFPVMNSGGTTWRVPKLNSIRGTENECDRMVNRFLDDEKIGVVSDYAWPDSWYIRDRACIKSIRGTPRDILEIMASDRDFWDPKKMGDPLSEEVEDNLPRVGSSFGVILARALADAGFPKGTLIRLRANLRLHPDSDSLFGFERAFVNAALREEEAGKLSELKAKVADIVHRAVDDPQAAGGEYFRALEKNLVHELSQL